MKSQSKQEEAPSSQPFKFKKFQREKQREYIACGYDPDDAASLARQAAKYRHGLQRAGRDPWENTIFHLFATPFGSFLKAERVESFIDREQSGARL